MDLKPLRKPYWLGADVFAALLQQAAPLPKCKRCETSDDLTVDHIKPRFDGGTDDLDNLQFLCRRCNSLKGIRPDSYWSQEFYWDKLPENLNGLRAAQKYLFAEITSDPGGYFCKSLSEIARLLYVCAWVVGAGKTIGIAVAAWALNFVVLRERGYVRRADRILVICKEEAIRDQIARDLATDLVGFGITGSAPNVGVITRSEQFNQQEWLDHFHVVVTCIQQLWQKDEVVRFDIARILATFPLIAIDEPHWAADRVATLVDAATSSLCIGFTGTPIDNAGRLLERMVGLSTYTYQDAVGLDRSLKYLDLDPDRFAEFVNELKIQDANVTRRGQPAVATDTSDPGYDKNLRPAEAVCFAVAKELKDADQLILANEQLAPHRSQPDIVMDLVYPRHAIIYFANIAAAEDGAASLNLMFDAYRGDYPREAGWHAEVVHSGTEKVAAKPLARANGAPPHPWMQCYRTGKLDGRCARILCCVGMAREGINNPLCGLTGVTCSIDSLFPAIQGWIGRQMRAVVKFLDGILHVPPALLDRVRLITHEVYDNTAALRAAIDFLCNMEKYFEGLPGINELLDAEYEPPTEAPSAKTPVSRREKIHILGSIIDAGAEGVEVSVKDIVDRWAPEPGMRRERIKKWVETCFGGDPVTLRKELRLDDGIKPVVTVRRERLQHNPSDEEIMRFIRTHHPDLSDCLPLSDATRKIFSRWCGEHANRFQQPRLTSTTDINTLARQIAFRVKNDVELYYQGDRNKPFTLAAAAVRRKLDVPREQKLANDSNWDTPETHAIIRRPDIQNELVSWIIARLVEEGDCGSRLQEALGVARYETHAQGD